VARVSSTASLLQIFYPLYGSLSALSTEYPVDITAKTVPDRYILITAQNVNDIHIAGSQAKWAYFPTVIDNQT
jgi:hypothetical protein